MYRIAALFGLVLAAALTCSAQLDIPVGGYHPDDNSHKNVRPTSRTLTGSVLDKADKPISDAVVYLKNTKTLAIKTYISQKDGTYRFPELALNVDYEIYAQKSGDKSKTKTLSQFDDRGKPTINLQLAPSK
jgi:hypothetical protein